MKKALCLTMLLLILQITGISAAGSNEAGYITEFDAYDLPHDDGSGIILQWKPLPKEQRIIKYNIYRGTSRDSLFLLTFVEVDPKLGVMAPYLYYYDTGDQPLLEFETSPRSLRPEKQQAAGSPLYQKFPLDSELLSTVIDEYSTYALLKAGNLYRKSRPILLDDTLMPGLKLIQLEGIYAIPKAGQRYFYCVVPMNEKGSLLPASEVMQAVPIDNPPNATAIVHSSYYPETGNLNLEWSPPAGVYDIESWQGWLLPRSELREDSRLPDNWQQNSLQIFDIPNSHDGQFYYHSEDLSRWDLDLNAYHPVLAYLDFVGQQAAVAVKSFRQLELSALPDLPNYQVMDKANDKGDVMLASFGKPLAYITLAEYTNKHHRKLKFNYEISKNENYLVDKIRFTFKTPEGVILGEVTEHYVDKVIHLMLPDEYQNIKQIRAEMAVQLLKSDEYEPELVSQEILYNDYYKRFQPQDTYIDAVDVSRLYFDLLRRSRLDWDFAPGARSNALSRTYEHIIPYEDVIMREILAYDAQSKRFLFDTRLGIDTDPQLGLSFDVPLYRSAFELEMTARQAQIAKLELALQEAPNAEDTRTELDYLQQEYSFITTHPAYLEASTAQTDKDWRKIMLAHRKIARRSYQYMLVATDTKSAFLRSEIYTDPSGKSWLMPEVQWFDTTKTLTLIATIILLFLVVYAIYITRRREVYIRPIAGLQEIDNAIGRATEMGRPVMFVPGWGSLGEVCTIASLMILAQVAKKTAEYDIRLINPHCDYMVLPLAQEIISTSYSEMGRPDSFNQNDIFFVSYDQFPFCAGVNGITVRDRVATIFYMGYFNAEALLLTETGNAAGAIQIAATDAVTQIPFFITTCDYTLIGEEFYAASAYLSRNHDMVSMLKAQDYFKIIIVFVVIIGTVLSTLHLNSFIHAFPLE